MYNAVFTEEEHKMEVDSSEKLVSGPLSFDYFATHI